MPAIQRCFAVGDAVVLIGQAVGRVVALEGMRMTVQIDEGDVEVNLDAVAGLLRHAVKKREARAALLQHCQDREGKPTYLELSEIAMVLDVPERNVWNAVTAGNPQLAALGTQRRVLPLAPLIEESASVRSFWVDGAARVGDLPVSVKPGAWHAYVFERGTVDDELVGIHVRHADLGRNVPLSGATLALRGPRRVLVDHRQRATAVFVADEKKMSGA